MGYGNRVRVEHGIGSVSDNRFLFAWNEVFYFSSGSLRKSLCYRISQISSREDNGGTRFSPPERPPQAGDPDIFGIAIQFRRR